MTKTIAAGVAALSLAIASQANAGYVHSDDASDSFKKEKKHFHHIPAFDLDFLPPGLEEQLELDGKGIFPILGYAGDKGMSAEHFEYKLKFLHFVFHEFLHYLASYDFDDKFGDGKHCWPKDPVPEVPVPAAAWLFGSALLSMAGAKLRKRK